MKQYTFLNENALADFLTGQIFEYPEMKREGNAIEYGLRGGIIGGVLGTGAGGYVGHKVAQGITGGHTRKIIKYIIINAKSPKDAIKKLETLNNGKSLDYINKIKKYESLPNWKEKILSGMRWRNAGISTSGIVPGSIIGCGIGSGVGAIAGGVSGYKKPV